MAKAGRKRSYEAYKRDYNSRKRTLAANGVQMNQRMYTETEFEVQYTRMRNKRLNDIKEGKRKTIGNITRDLIDKQAFALSTKQAAAITKSARKDRNYYQVRSGQAIEEFEFDKFNEYMEKHPDANNEDALRYARKEISTEFFGSP